MIGRLDAVDRAPREIHQSGSTVELLGPVANGARIPDRVLPPRIAIRTVPRHDNNFPPTSGEMAREVLSEKTCAAGDHDAAHRRRVRHAAAPAQARGAG